MQPTATLSQAHALPYRPHIDGLRAFAVMLVLLFHFFPGAVPGGYIGVDVFYVISGYLISGIIWSELQQGTFTYTGFIVRRIRRLWPVFAIVLITVLAAGWLLALPDQLVELADVTLSAIALSANWYFAFTTDYFNTEAHSNALLHTWSLGVEEQFYIFFPFILAFLFKRKRLLASTLLLIGFGSLFASAVDGLYGTRADAFFFTHLRLWELLAGVGAMLVQKHPAWRAPHWHKRADVIMACSGLTLILLSAFLYSSETRFPGIAALLPVVGALLCLLAGDLCRSTVHGYALATYHLLTNRTVVYIGRISYGLYLWHWPIMVWLHTLFPETPIAYSLAAIALTFGLSALSFHAFELPVRQRRLLATRLQMLVFMNIGMALLVGASWLVVQNSGYPQRIPSAAIEALKTTVDPQKSGLTCLTGDQLRARFGNTIKLDAKARQQWCLLGDTKKKTVDFILWGDSHAEAIMGAVHADAKAKKKLGLAATFNACPPLLGLGWKNLDADKTPRCGAANDSVVKTVQALHPPVVLMVGHWDIYAPRASKNGEVKPGRLQLTPSTLAPDLSTLKATEWFDAALRTTVDALAPYTTVRTLLDVPTHDVAVPQAIANQIRWPWLPAPHWLTRKEQLAARQTYAPLFNGLAHDKKIALFDPLDLFCPADVCLAANKDGKPLFYDRNHVSAYGAAHLLQGMPGLVK